VTSLLKKITGLFTPDGVVKKLEFRGSYLNSRVIDFIVEYFQQKVENMEGLCAPQITFTARDVQLKGWPSSCYREIRPGGALPEGQRLGANG